MNRTNYVPALHEPEPSRPMVIDVDPITLPHAALTRAETSGTYLDRAKGFQVVSVPLAAAVGAGSLLIGIAGFGVPVLSVAALLWLWAGFLATWLAAWIVHNVVSADGVALVHTILGWSLIYREQTERHRRYREGRQ